MRLEQGRRRAGTIGLTPLIDVVFILLLFFMLSTQFDDYRAIPVNVPGEVGAAAASDDPPLSLLLLGSGEVRIAGKVEVEPGALDQHPLMRDALAGGRKVRLQGEATVSLQSLVSLMDRLAAMGIEGLALGRPS